MGEAAKKLNADSQKKVGYKDILKETEFLKLLIAKLISRFGDSIDMVAYGWMVFQLTGSSALLASLYAVSGIPSFVFNMVSGVVVTYLPKKKVVYICDFGRGFTVLLTAILFMTGNLAVWHLFVFAFLNSTFEAFRGPASAPLFAKLVPEDKYDYAISADTTGTKIAELIGYSVAGVLVGTLGVGLVIVIDAATFFLSGLLISILKIEKENLEKVELTTKKYFSDLKEGISYVVKDGLILNICLFAGLFNLLMIPFNALLPAYADEVLKKGPEAISFISIAMLASMLIGGVIAPVLKSKISNRAMFLLAGFTFSLGYFCLSQLGMLAGTNFIYVGVLFACILMGVAVPILNLPIKVGIMSKIEREYLPRSVALINALSLSSTPIGGGLVGFLIVFMSLKEVYMIFSAVIALLFIAQCFNKSLKEL